MAKLCNCRICGIQILNEDICDICKKTNNKEKTFQLRMEQNKKLAKKELELLLKATNNKFNNQIQFGDK